MPAVRFRSRIGCVARQKTDSDRYDSQAVSSILVTDNGLACATNGRIMAIARADTGGLEGAALLPSELSSSKVRDMCRAVDFGVEEKTIRSGGKEYPIETRSFPRLDLVALPLNGNEIEVVIDVIELLRLAKGLCEHPSNKGRSNLLSLMIDPTDPYKPIAVTSPAGGGLGLIIPRLSQNGPKKYREALSMVATVTKILKEIASETAGEKAPESAEIVAGDVPPVPVAWRGRGVRGVDIGTAVQAETLTAIPIPQWTNYGVPYVGIDGQAEEQDED